MVDSRTTSAPGLSIAAADSVAALTAVRSGPSDSDSGVGTQITVTSGALSPASSARSAVARKPPSTIVSMSASVRSSMWLRPALRPSTVDCLDVKAGYVQADPDGLLGQRQAHVAKPDDHHVHETDLLEATDL